MESQPTVYIVDDDKPVREALTLLMKADGQLTRSYASAEEFLEDLTPTSKGCVLLDVRMPGLSGIELQQVLKNKHVTLQVIIMTGYADVPMAVQAMKAGAVDFIEKPFDNDRLLNQVQVCLQMCVQAQSERLQQQAADEKTARLTRRERQVMEMLVQGHQNRLIAEKLGISPRTVEIHRARVMEKLEVHSLSDVVRIALLASNASDDAHF